MLCSCQCCLLPSFLITPRTKCESWKVPPHSLPTSSLTLVNPFIYFLHLWVQFSSVQLLSRVRLFETPWKAARQATLSIANSRSLLKLMSIESMMPSNHLILCRPLPLLPSILPSLRVFSNVSVLYIRWPKHWSFRFSVRPSNEYSGRISFKMDWLDLLAVHRTLNSLFQHQGSKASVFHLSALSPALTSIHDYWKNHSFD